MSAALLLAGHAFAQRFDYAARVSAGEPVHLSLVAMASLPGNVVFVGGSFRTGTGPLHTGLLLSRDGGRTWTTTNIKLANAGIHAIATAGTQHVWALATMQQEGTDDPAFIAMSADAGKTWQVVTLPAVTVEGIVEVKDFRLLDAQHGLLVVESSLGKGAVYSTSDGGRKWRIQWATSPGVVDGYRYPAEPVPLHATLWRAPGESAAGLLRVIREDGKPHGYRIQQYRPPTTEWEDVGSISTQYRVEAGVLSEAPD